jgi:type IV pilus assembly protein PilC
MSKIKKTKLLPQTGTVQTEHANAHPRLVDLVDVVRKVVPFLFPAKKVKRMPQIIVHTAADDKKKKAARTLRKAVHTLEIQKEVSAKKATVSAAQTVSVTEKPKGKILSPASEEKMSKTQVALEKEALSTEDGFMAKVVTPTVVPSSSIAKPGFWSFLSYRFGSKEEKTESLKDDQFLNRVEQKRSDSVVGLSVDDPAASLPPDLGVRPTPISTPPSALESFAAEPEKNPTVVETSKGKIISAMELKKEAEAQKEMARRVAEQTKKEIEQERSAPKKEEVKEAPADAPKKKVNKPYASSGGMQKLVAALAHFGMGKERMQFTENLATMLDAGLPLVDSLQTLKLETRNKGFKKVVARIVERVENGTPLWRSMDAEDFFSLHAIALIRIGEEAGSLAKNMQYLAAQETKDHELVQKVKMAMIYPSIVLSIMFVIVMGLGIFVLPNLIGVLTSLNVPLPLVTRLVIGFSYLFSTYGLIIVPGSLIFIGIFIILAKYTALKVWVQWVTFRIPGIGSLLRSATIARFGVILGGLLAAGVPVVDSVQSLVEVTPILVYKHLYEKLRDHITIGDSFAKSFASIKGSEKLLPASVQQLVITGEKSGALAAIMLKVADIYDKKATETAQKLPVILEPILLLGIGTLVGTIAFAIIVPIYSIVGSVGRQ